MKGLQIIAKQAIVEFDLNVTICSNGAEVGQALLFREADANFEWHSNLLCSGSGFCFTAASASSLMQAVVSANRVDQCRNHKHPYCPSNEDVRSILERDGEATDGKDANNNVDFVLGFWVHK